MGLGSSDSSIVSANEQQGPSKQPLGKVYGMVGGEGQGSYSKNSEFQAHVNSFVLHLINEALEFVTLPTQGPLTVADLGCSSGANTIDNLTNIVDNLKARFADAPCQEPDFHAFFNDLLSNDFNNLFQILSSDPRTSKESGGNLFVGGVPGSFYGRLFPRSSVHVFFSSHSLHWMSKVPDGVLDEDSPAYNKCNVYMSSPAVATAYKEQALIDLKNFLDARAAELAPGGLLFLVFGGRSNPKPDKPFDSNISRALWDLNDEVWSDLILQGVLTEEQRATFNLPLYFRTPEEVQEALEVCRSAFHIQSAKLHPVETKLSEVFQTLEPSNLSRKVTWMFKSVLNGLLEAHVGKEAGEVFWKHYEKSVEKLVPGILLRDQGGQSISWHNILSLIRK